MHEASIVQSLLGTVDNAVVGTGAVKVARIEISVGRLKAVEPALLCSCFEFLAEGTICEGAELVVKNTPILVRCNDCGETSDISGYRFECGTCASNKLEIVSGGELRVDRIQAFKLT